MELVNSYGLSDALTDVGMSGAEGYSMAVKGGLIGTKGAGRVAADFVPYVGYALFAKDAYTFMQGFGEGWNDYGR